ncbi:hypothetical protein SELMODRAFT_90248 [Selaginella moellendorffii]|uniref:Rit1 N-terminal domain-containing protein n=1 Tax=Selaginella moellendorffii TaxID=88036 RepID=D8RCX3_SELML|nr:hypothetical protein SELMODRAFT_90248 [Selaginella moellendorffii]
MENEHSIYKIARSIKRKEQSLYNALRSIYDDAGFVAEIRALRPALPLVANLRCGLWYARKFDDTCYFKSTDGHTGNWGFNPARLNIHIAAIAARSGGCMIVDSTRKGKRFPDSMSKTIPIWTCVMNRGISMLLDPDKRKSWDCELHLPSWVSETEKSCIQARLDQWVGVLLASGADLAGLAASLERPLRPLWISQRSLIWLDEIPEPGSLDFTPVILISASRPRALERCSDSEAGWSYIPGAGDDEESWARGLTPGMFWSNALDIIDAGPDECNAKVAEIVRRDGRPWKVLQGWEGNGIHGEIANGDTGIRWIGNTGLALGASKSDFIVSLCFLFALPCSLLVQPQELLSIKNVSVIDCSGHLDVSFLGEGYFLSLNIQDSKFDRYCLQNNLPAIVEFAIRSLGKKRNLLVCCRNGGNISVSVCLAILMACFNKDGMFFSYENLAIQVMKEDIREKLVYVSAYVPNVYPSRGNLKQVYNYFKKRKNIS